MKTIQIVSIALISLSLSACGGGSGAGINYEAVCVDGHDPITQDADHGHEKLSFDDALSDIPPGVYSHAGGELFIKDPMATPSKTTSVHVRDNIQEKSGQYVPTVGCVSGFSKATAFQHEIRGYSSMNIDPNKKMDATVRTFKVSFGLTNGSGKPEGLKTNFVEAGPTQEKPSSLYKGKEGAESEVFFFKTAADQFEIRSIDTYPNGLQIKLVTRYTRKDK